MVAHAFSLKKISGAREVVQPLKVLVALAENTIVYNHLKFQFQGIQHPPLSTAGTRDVHGTHEYVQASTQTHKINLYNNKKSPLKQETHLCGEYTHTH